jgi:hypothetical protein
MADRRSRYDLGWAMRQPTFVGSSITTRGGDAEVHGRMLRMAPIELVELLLGANQADLETVDLAEPAFRLGFGDSGIKLSRISASRARWTGSGRRSEHLTQACS